MKENLDESFLNLLFPENDDDGDDNALNGDSAEEASSDGMNDDIESNVELTPGNTTDEEYERKFQQIVLGRIKRAKGTIMSTLDKCCHLFFSWFRQ